MFSHLPLKFLLHLLPSLTVSFPSSEITGLNMVLGLDLLPMGFHSHHDAIDLSAEGV